MFRSGARVIPPLSGTLPNRTEAEAWATKMEDDINQVKQYGFSRVRDVADAVDAFKAVRTSSKTADDRSRHLTWWRNNFGERKLLHFIGDTVDQGREQLAIENIEPDPKKASRHRSPQTVCHYLMSLGSGATAAVS